MKQLALLFLLLPLVFSLPQDCGQVQPPVVPPLNTTDLQLVQVSIIFRHGDRIMYQDVPCWPNDQGVYTCESTHLSTPSFVLNQTIDQSGRLFRKKYLQGRNFYQGNCETGQLTNKGYVQETLTGQMYRQVYIDSGFLPETFDPTKIYLRSDEGDRCVQSLETLLQGMYPTLATNQDYAIYDINTMDTYYDNIVPNGNICPLVNSYMYDVSTSPTYVQHYETYTVPLYERLSEALGYPVFNWNTFAQVHDCLTVHACHNQPIPPGVDSDLFNEVMDEFNYSYKLFYDYPNPVAAAQAGIGNFVQEITGPMLQAVSNSTDIKLLMYSGHDTTVLPLLNAFNNWNGTQWAMYASQVQLEIYLNATSQEYFIRGAYNGENLLFPGCDSPLCSWDTFYGYCKTIFPTQSTCGAPVTHDISHFNLLARR